jgi:hypothetical protein
MEPMSRSNHLYPPYNRSSKSVPIQQSNQTIHIAGANQMFVLYPHSAIFGYGTVSSVNFAHQSQSKCWTDSFRYCSESRSR